jgi:valyl-tRNA synthetase
VDREVPIVEDDYVVMPGQAGDPKAEYATGFLKVTPAHDPNDWQIGERHDLAVINVMAPDGSISADHGWRDHEEPSPEAAKLLGLSREAARERVVDWFKSNDLLEETRPYRHDIGHSYRSHVPIEPYLSDQWYVRVTDDRMRGEALRAMAPEQREGGPPQRDSAVETSQGDGDLRFNPARYARTFQAWHENLRDWCISRQLWWGHRIPVWTADPETQPLVTETDAGRKLLSEKRIAEHRPQSLAGRQRRRDGVDLHHVCVRAEDDHEAVEILEQAGYAQDPDVLDTWFSSALWPISTMGWPDPSRFPDTQGLLEVFNPSSVLVTARDIITLWVSRMVMFNRYLRDGRLPFRDVYINPMIQDGHGQRMSKSLGNGVDPREIIDSHGADALRFVMVDVATSTQDARMPVDLLCPHCGTIVHPAEMTSPAGYRVAEPVQTCSSCRKTMTSGYGAATGATGGGPLARNTSDRFDRGRNFANKLWNATRFSLGQLAAGVPGPNGISPKSLPLVDRWMISRLHGALRTIEGALEQYHFSVYGEAIYDLVWADFCDQAQRRREPGSTSDASNRARLHPACGSPGLPLRDRGALAAPAGHGSGRHGWVHLLLDRQRHPRAIRVATYRRRRGRRSRAGDLRPRAGVGEGHPQRQERAPGRAEEEDRPLRAGRAHPARGIGRWRRRAPGGSRPRGAARDRRPASGHVHPRL